MLWEIDVYPLSELLDREGVRIASMARELGIADSLQVHSARGFLLESDSLTRDHAERLARELFADAVVEQATVGRVGDSVLTESRNGAQTVLLQILLKPGVMDPVAQSAISAVRDFGFSVSTIRTVRKYWVAGATQDQLQRVSARILANDAIEQVVEGPFPFDRLQMGGEYKFQLRTVPLRELDDAGLAQLSRQGQLYLQLPEMRTIQGYFGELGRDPTDIELETFAQTWSEHCSHKTLAGRIAYRDEHGDRQFENMLKETIFAATNQLRQSWGDRDWCVSVFRDNAGIVRFTDEFNICFKVETHNHPSALEPYGGANTGVGGVIRDTMGTGLGAKPVCNTDVFCFAPPDTPIESLPPGVLNPRQILRGVVSGVRDYGNRMGIPTVNGAVLFDARYSGNPLVYCGNVGLIPTDKSFKKPRPNDLIVAIGGRTGRDGIHGATFSSAELTHESDTLSGGAVQIGNAIEEKKLLDVLLTLRDRGLYTSVTDCGAGGFSSAVGEMGEKIGAEVWLDRAPLKYEGLSYTEIWISEAQERMVLSVPQDSWDELHSLCEAEGVEATVIGRFAPTGRLNLKYQGHTVGDIDMEFLHGGRPPVIRSANFTPRPSIQLEIPSGSQDFTEDLRRILSSYNVASKEWIVRQYDHEVQGGSVIKPLVGANCDGPSDAAVVRPLLDSWRGIVVACGINPHYGDYDPYHMAASAIDEAIRNCVAVGADPSRVALLDNFCWGDCEKSETLGSLVRAALACHDLSLVLETPFISGKDSLNNEFSYIDEAGEKRTIAIPPTLLISALGQIEDISTAITMDFKHTDSLIYVVGVTKEELGGSHFSLVHSLFGGTVPRVDAKTAKATFAAVHEVIKSGIVRSCHDLSEGGLATALAEMCFAGGIGAEVLLQQIPTGGKSLATHVLLFSESNTRFLCEVRPEYAQGFENLLSGVPHACIGHTNDSGRLTITGVDSSTAINCEIARLKAAWQAALAYNS